MGIRYACDICEEPVDPKDRKPIGMASVSDVCKDCEEVLRKTVDLMRISPWSKKVIQVHKQVIDAIARSKE